MEDNAPRGLLSGCEVMTRPGSLEYAAANYPPTRQRLKKRIGYVLILTFRSAKIAKLALTCCVVRERLNSLVRKFLEVNIGLLHGMLSRLLKSLLGGEPCNLV